MAQPSEKHFEYLLWPFTTYGHFWVRCTHRGLQEGATRSYDHFSEGIQDIRDLERCAAS